jgi:hypothetical protein
MDDEREWLAERLGENRTHLRAVARREALLSDSVGLALLVVLDTLTPAERLAFVLRAMFDLPSTRSARSWDARRPRHASSPAAPAAGYAGWPRHPASIHSASVSSTLRSPRD